MIGMLNGHGIDLADYLEQPTLVSRLSREQLAALIGECEQLKALCWARLMSIPTAPPEAKPEAEKMLTIEEAATLLHKKPQYLYRNKHRLPFIKKIGPTSYICSPAELQRWLATRKV